MSVRMLRFTVLGIPAPKGSTKAFIPKGWKRAIITADNKRTKPWQQFVLEAATTAKAELADWEPLEGPLAVIVRFYLPRPKSAPRSVTEPAKKPDGDKLERAFWDGLVQAGVVRDDAQFTRWSGSKDFAGGVHDPAGANGIPRAEVIVGPSELFVRAHMIGGGP